jgi:hypothetical protein
MHICIIWMMANTLYVIHGCGNHFGLIWGLNHSIRAWFLSDGHTIKTSADFQDSRPTDVTISVWWWIHIPLLSTSNEWWQTPSIWQARIWQPHCIWSMHQSQHKHKGVVSVRGTHMFLADFSKPSPSTFTIAVWWWIHMPIYGIYLLLYVRQEIANKFVLVWGLKFDLV